MASWEDHPSSHPSFPSVRYKRSSFIILITTFIVENLLLSSLVLLNLVTQVLGHSLCNNLINDSRCCWHLDYFKNSHLG